MSYAVSLALQKAVFDGLTADATLTALVGANVFDQAPGGTVPDLFVVLGDDKARDRSDQSGHGSAHDMTISVVTTRPGFADAKAAGVAICDALLGPVLVLERGRMLNASFLTARARREAQGARRIVDLIFRFRVSDE